MQLKQTEAQKFLSKKNGFNAKIVALDNEKKTQAANLMCSANTRHFIKFVAITNA